ncbi:MAG: hypothetical protein IJ849_03735 [Selenomonadaceae bacterium]|nr:hypothetical protein [Selenomonadaceae bacterium]
MNKLTMEKLQPIPYDKDLTEFDLTRTPWSDDRLATELTLDDYSWMVYELSTFFPTKKYGDLELKFRYKGYIYCELYIKQTVKTKGKTPFD